MSDLGYQELRGPLSPVAQLFDQSYRTIAPRIPEIRRQGYQNMLRHLVTDPAQALQVNIEPLYSERSETFATRDSNGKEINFTVDFFRLTQLFQYANPFDFPIDTPILESRLDYTSLEPDSLASIRGQLSLLENLIEETKRNRSAQNAFLFGNKVQRHLDSLKTKTQATMATLSLQTVRRISETEVSRLTHGGFFLAEKLTGDWLLQPFSGGSDNPNVFGVKTITNPQLCNDIGKLLDVMVSRPARG